MSHRILLIIIVVLFSNYYGMEYFYQVSLCQSTRCAILCIAEVEDS